MKFYIPHTQFYCGVDLHARSMYICVIDGNKKILVHQNVRNRDTELFLKQVKPYKHDIVVSAESTYAWYWLADLCADNGIEFILGHALYMKAIHGAKVKNDRIDSQKIAMLTQSGMFPSAYVYPKEKRSIRDLLRRRLYFAQERADMFCHIQLMNTQVNNPALGRITKSNYKKKAIAINFDDEHTQKSIDSDLKLIGEYDQNLKRVFSEAAVFVVKFNPNVEKYFNRITNKKGKPKAYGIISRKLAQAIYYMLKTKTVFNEKLFLGH